MAGTWWWCAGRVGAALALATLAACGADLGECDMAALGGSDGVTLPGPARPHNGQVLVDQRCASSRCHSATAAGALRVGAPAELDFDLVPRTTAPAELARVQTGYNVVQDHLEAMWDAIDSGQMPPPAPAGSGELPAAEKEVVRNWLACGAPVIATPVPVDPMDDPWTQIYNALNQRCGGCHAPGLGMGSFLPAPAAPDPCAARAMLVGVAASGPVCGTSGAVLVQPGNPAGSLLLQKLKATPAPPCGATMPFGLDPLEVTDPALVAQIEQWIAAGATAPMCP